MLLIYRVKENLQILQKRMVSLSLRTIPENGGEGSASRGCKGVNVSGVDGQGYGVGDD